MVAISCRPIINNNHHHYPQCNRALGSLKDKEKFKFGNEQAETWEHLRTQNSGEGEVGETFSKGRVYSSEGSFLLSARWPALMERAEAEGRGT